MSEIMEVINTLQEEKQEATEFITLLKTMSESEKQQIKGVMIGIKLSRTTTAEAQRA